MKESKLIEMQNRIETLGQVAQKLMHDNQQLTQLAVGTLETIKLFPGYDKAIKKLQEEITKKSSKTKEVTSDREDSK